MGPVPQGGARTHRQAVVLAGCHCRLLSPGSCSFRGVLSASLSFGGCQDVKATNIK